MEFRVLPPTSTEEEDRAQHVRLEFEQLKTFDAAKGLRDCWTIELQDLLLMLPTKAANACLKSLRQWRHGGTGGASQHVKDGETCHGETFQCANGGTGGASQHVKDAARELYKNVISAAWKETFQHIITSLALIYSPDDVVKMEKEICDAEPEDYAPLYSELFDKYETKRIELKEATKPENNIGKSWHQGLLKDMVPEGHGAELHCDGPGRKRKYTRVNTEEDGWENNVRKPRDPGMANMEDAAKDDDPGKAFSYFNTLSEPNFCASRSPPTLDRS